LSETLIAAGYVREVKAKASAPTWRQDGGSGAAFALKLTAAGMKAFGWEGSAAESKDLPAGRDDPSPTQQAPATEAEVGKRPAGKTSVSAAPARGAPRPTSKIASVIGLLSRVEGATLADLIAATDWLPHTTRAALTGLRKRGYTLVLDRKDRERGSVYQITLPPDRGALSSTKIAVEAS
jgi:hypothetical protein